MTTDAAQVVSLADWRQRRPEPKQVQENAPQRSGAEAPIGSSEHVWYLSRFLDGLAADDTLALDYEERSDLASASAYLSGYGRLLERFSPVLDGLFDVALAQDGEAESEPPAT